MAGMVPKGMVEFHLHVTGGDAGLPRPLEKQPVEGEKRSNYCHSDSSTSTLSVCPLFSFLRANV